MNSWLIRSPRRQGSFDSSSQTQRSRDESFVRLMPSSSSRYAAKPDIRVVARTDHSRGAWPAGLPQVLHKLSRLTWSPPKNSTCCLRADRAQSFALRLIALVLLRFGLSSKVVQTVGGEI